MSIAAPPRDQQFLIQDADWPAYQAMLRAVGDRHVFVTYSQGRLELMAPSWEHDARAERIGQLIRILAEELNIPLIGGGSTTFRREDLDRGLEPDRCYYIANQARVRGRTEIDLAVDPPPDLCVEVELSRRLLDRIEIYQRLGVPELWRDNGRILRVFALADGVYVERPNSPALAPVTVAQMNQLLDLAEGLDDTAWSRKVRAQVKERG